MIAVNIITRSAGTYSDLKRTQKRLIFALVAVRRWYTIMKMLRRWNYDEQVYEPYEVPDNWNVKSYSEDMERDC